MPDAKKQYREYYKYRADMEREKLMIKDRNGRQRPQDDLTDESREDFEIMMQNASQFLYVEDAETMVQRWVREYEQEKTPTFGAKTAKMYSQVWGFGCGYAVNNPKAEQKPSDEVRAEFIAELVKLGMPRDEAELNAVLYTDGVNYANEMLKK